MAVTADQVETLRSLLERRIEDHDRQREQLNAQGEGAGYLAMVEAACFLEIDRRFTPETSEAEVVVYVADIRTRSERATENLDPEVAERLIRGVLGHGDIDDIDDATRFGTELVVLGALVIDRDADAAEIDSLLQDARKLADRWLAA